MLSSVWFQNSDDSLHSNINWSSPELLSGQRRLVNQAADVWSLSMVIVEIMTGEVPYDTPEYRSLPLDEFIHRLKANERPSLPKVFLQKLWLEDMVSDWLLLLLIDLMFSLVV